MQVFTNTHIQTTLRLAGDFTVVQFLGCGIIVCHTETAINGAKLMGCKLHNVLGRKVGFSLFTYAI